MNTTGLALAVRYSYPPNSLSLCGPDRMDDLLWYTSSQKVDKGAGELLSRFATLYPYLLLIAGENNIKDPFDPNVIEAYWLGNRLLHTVGQTPFQRFLMETLLLGKKLPPWNKNVLLELTADGALPHHAFHVVSVYRRTGHHDVPHTIETMDACIVNWGKVVEIFSHTILLETRPLIKNKYALTFGPSIQRKIRAQGKNDTLLASIKKGDWVSYHWGQFCQKLSASQLRNLVYYTNKALRDSAQKFPS